MEKEVTCRTSIPCPTHEQRRARAMNVLKETMLKLAMSRDPSRSQSQKQMLAKCIDVRLPSLFPSPLQTPNHPPYAEMIFVAVGELKKKKGSTKTSISNFIKSNYQDLPLAHEHLLAHHLEKLVQEGMIVSVTKSLYALPICNYPSIENHQQAAEHQLRVVGVEMANYDVNDNELVALPEKHPTTALVEVVEPMDVDDSGVGMIALQKKHSTALIEVDLDDNGENISRGLKHWVVLTEEPEPLQKKLRRSSLRLINKKRNLEQPEEEVLEINEVIQSVAATVSDGLSAGQTQLIVSHPKEKQRHCQVRHIRMICNGKDPQQAVVRQDDDEQGLIALPEKYSAAVTELESMGGTDTIGLLKMAPEALHEVVSPMVLVEKDDSDLGLPWLKPTLEANNYIPCEIHADFNKSECNMFCVDCMGNPLCSYCLVHHKDHHIVKISRYNHHDIINVNEAQKYMDISGVQTCTINKEKSVYLNYIPQKKYKGGTIACEICRSRVHYNFRFCSLRCKIAKRNLILPNMEETSWPTTDCEKQQQLIVVGGEMNNDVQLAMVKVVEPLDFDDAGGWLMKIPGNHSTPVIGNESHGGVDSDDEGMKHSVAIIEEIKPMQTKLCQYSRRRIHNKKLKFEQQEEEVVNISEINTSIAATVNDDPSIQTELNTPYSYSPGQQILCQVGTSRKTSSREQEQVVAQDEVEPGLMAPTENYPTVVIGLDLIDGDGDRSIGLLEKAPVAVFEEERTTTQELVSPVVSEEKLDDDLGNPRLKAMLKAKFHIPCEFHDGEPNKNGCNMFCLDCLGNPLCYYCLVYHKDHHIVKIRRNSHQNKIKMDEIKKYMDISGVQICTGKTIYLNDAPLRRNRKGLSGSCEICSRRLHRSFRFCSLGCKQRRCQSKSLEKEHEGCR